MVLFVVTERDTSSVKGIINTQVSRSFSTRAEAEQRLKDIRIERRGANVQVKQLQEGQTAFKDEIIQSVEARKEAGRKQAISRREALAEQAKQKVGQLQTLSVAEQQALQKSTVQRIPGTEEINRQIREEQQRQNIISSLQQRQKQAAQKQLTEDQQKQAIISSLQQRQQAAQKQQTLQQEIAQRTGSIRGLTAAEETILKREQSPIFRAGRAFKESVFLEEEAGRRLASERPEERLAAAIGFPFAVGFGGRTKLATKGKAAFQASQKAIKRLQQTQAGRFTTDLIITSIKGAAVVEGVKKGAALTAGQERREAAQREGFKEAFKTAFGEETQAVGEKGILQSIGFQISPFIAGEPKTFEKSLRESFKQQGLTGENLETAVSAGLRQRKAAAAGEAAALLEISRSAEGIGRRGVTTALEKASKRLGAIPKKGAGLELFKVTAPQIAKAGVVEGATQQLTQDIARGQDIQAKDIAIGAGLGGLSAGIIGGGIVGTKINLPKTSKVIEIGTFITDPFEKPGDIAQDIAELATVKILKKPRPRVPTITETIDPKDILKIGVSQPKKTKSKA